jgi:MFS transporter, FHS family, Na+ dependent glucose transporter 1
MGSIDAGCNALLAFLHGDACDPYYHAMHLLFTSGAAISPLILEVVLSAGQSFKYAWWVIGIVMISAAILLPTYESPQAPDSKTSLADVHSVDEFGSNSSPSKVDVIEYGSFLDDSAKHRWWCACVASSFLLVYYGCEVAFGSLLTSYVRLQRLGTPSQANFMTFSFWAAQSCGLACSIFISHRKVQPKFMLFGNLVLMGSGLSLLWIFRAHLVGSWVAAVVFGLGVSSGFPTMINLLQTYTEITGKVSSLISVASAVGEMTIPAVIGSRMENAGYSPSIMIAILGFGFSIQAAVYVVLVATARPKPVRREEIVPMTTELVSAFSDKTDTFPSENSRFVDW